MQCSFVYRPCGRLQRGLGDVNTPLAIKQSIFLSNILLCMTGQCDGFDLRRNDERALNKKHESKD